MLGVGLTIDKEVDGFKVLILVFREDMLGDLTFFIMKIVVCVLILVFREDMLGVVAAIAHECHPRS